MNIITFQCTPSYLKNTFLQTYKILIFRKIGPETDGITFNAIRDGMLVQYMKKIH